jgi:3-hydroxyisobutyrate dehydrogenase-like beta-hydroxyacid dehydrogenase
MRIVLTLLMAVLLAGSAEAQSMRKRHRADTATQNDDQKKKRADEKAYKSAIEKMPDKKFDPWAKVR